MAGRREPRGEERFGAHTDYSILLQVTNLAPASKMTG